MQPWGGGKTHVLSPCVGAYAYAPVLENAGHGMAIPVRGAAIDVT